MRWALQAHKAERVQREAVTSTGPAAAGGKRWRQPRRAPGLSPAQAQLAAHLAAASKPSSRVVNSSGWRHAHTKCTRCAASAAPARRREMRSRRMDSRGVACQRAQQAQVSANGPAAGWFAGKPADPLGRCCRMGIELGGARLRCLLHAAGGCSLHTHTAARAAQHSPPRRRQSAGVRGTPPSSGCRRHSRQGRRHALAVARRRSASGSASVAGGGGQRAVLWAGVWREGK